MPNDDLATRAEVMAETLDREIQRWEYASRCDRAEAGKRMSLSVSVVSDAATLITNLLAERAADKERIGRLEGALRAILDLTCVGRPGSTGFGSKWCSYPSKLYHAARTALSTGPTA